VALQDVYAQRFERILEHILRDYEQRMSGAALDVGCYTLLCQAVCGEIPTQGLRQQ